MSLQTELDRISAAMTAFATQVGARLTACENDQDAETLGGLTKEQIIEVIVGSTGLTLGDIQADLDAFKARVDNPHSVTAAQVGLDLIVNRAQADQTLAEQAALGTITTSVAGYDNYVNALGLSQAFAKYHADLIGLAPETLDTIEEVAAAIAGNQSVLQTLQDGQALKADQSALDTAVQNLTSQINAIDAAGLGLDAVENLAVGTVAELEAATPVRKYVTGDNLKTVLDNRETALLLDVDNRIQLAVDGLATTKEDVGLGLVVNAGFATAVQAADETNDAVYMNPARTHEVVNAAIQAYNDTTIVNAFTALATSVEAAQAIVTP